MIWGDRETSQVVAQKVKRTLAGGLVVFAQQLTAGEEITLAATDEQGWLTKDQVDQVMGLAVVPGAQYPLQVGAEFFTVMFRHEDPPAFEASPLIERLNPDAGDYYTASLKLITV